MARPLVLEVIPNHRLGVLRALVLVSVDPMGPDLPRLASKVRYHTSGGAVIGTAMSSIVINAKLPNLLRKKIIFDNSSLLFSRPLPAFPSRGGAIAGTIPLRCLLTHHPLRLLVPLLALYSSVPAGKEVVVAVSPLSGRP